MTIKEPVSDAAALRIGGELRSLRQDAGMTLEHVTRQLGWTDHTRLSKLERAKLRTSALEIGTLLDFYGVSGEERLDLEALVTSGRRTAWWRDFGNYLDPADGQYIVLEAEAERLREYQGAVPPAVLQSREYRRHVLLNSPEGLGEDAVEAYLEMHEYRVERLYEDPKIQVHAVIGEFMRQLDTGGAKVMHEQYRHLMDLAQLPNVEIHIVPLSAGRRGYLPSGFSILDFPGAKAPFAFVESMAGFLPQESARAVGRVERLMQRVLASALPPAQSVEYIKTWMK